MGKHARRSPVPALAAVSAVALGAAAAVAMPAGGHAPALRAEPAQPWSDDAHVQHMTTARPPVAMAEDQPGTYTVQPGDTLSGIAARFCGDAADYEALAVNNDIADPNLIYARRVLRLACQAAARQLSGVSSGPADPPPAVVTSAGGTLSCAGLEALWQEAGGSPAEEFTAAEIAMAESGGDTDAISPTDDYGPWQINASWGPAMATLNPLGNAEAAVKISGDGTDWSAWTTYREGLYEGRC
jgi:LysM repeat protein